MLDLTRHPIKDRTRLPALQIGAVTLTAPVILAPMSGVTDRPFRQMVGKFGAGMVVTEMIASHSVIRECRKTARMSQKAADEGLVAVQLAGCEPHIIAEAARLNEDRGADLIDLNFGCPVKKVVNGHAGSFLMRDEIHAAKILEATVRAVKVPVTMKMRMGWDHENLNAPQLAKIGEECGVRMVTVHGRTRGQLYGGVADWGFVARVKAAVGIPVIVNGDIGNFASVTRALELSGADGVMIGRGAYGRPWFLGQVMEFLREGVAPDAPPLLQQYEIARAHFEAMLEHYGAYAGLRIARKHFGWYSAGLPGAAEFRGKINRAGDVAVASNLLREFYGALI